MHIIHVADHRKLRTTMDAATHSSLRSFLKSHSSTMSAKFTHSREVSSFLSCTSPIPAIPRKLSPPIFSLHRKATTTPPRGGPSALKGLYAMLGPEVEVPDEGGVTHMEHMALVDGWRTSQILL